MTQPIDERDEYPVAAGTLDASFIGQPFGLDRGSSTFYGTIAAVRQQPEEVVVWVQGVPGADSILRLAPDELLRFSRTTWTARVQSLLGSIDARLDPARASG